MSRYWRTERRLRILFDTTVGTTRLGRGEDYQSFRNVWDQQEPGIDCNEIDSGSSFQENMTPRAAHVIIFKSGF